MSTPSSTPAAPAAAAAPVVSSKLSGKAPAFNPSAPAFTPSSASAAAPAAAAATTTAAPKLNKSAAAFNPSAKPFSPSPFVPTAVYAPPFVPAGAMRGMAMGPAFPPQQMVMAPGGFFPTQQFIPGVPFYPQTGFVPTPYGMMPAQMVQPNPNQLLSMQQQHSQQQQQHAQQQQQQQQQNNQQQQQQHAAAQQQQQQSNNNHHPQQQKPLLSSPATHSAPAPTGATPTHATPAAAAPKKDSTPSAAATPVAAAKEVAKEATPAATPVAATPAAAAAAPAASTPVAAAPKSFAAATAAAAAAAAAADSAAPVDKAAAASSFGVKPVTFTRSKASTVAPAERKREPKKEEEPEAIVKEVRQRAGSANAEAEEPVAAKPTIAVPSSAASALPPTHSPSGSRKQTTADAESSLASAISSLKYGRDFLLSFQHINTTPPEGLLAGIEQILKGEGGSANATGEYARPGGGLRPGAGLRPGGMGQRPRMGDKSTPAVPSSGASARAGFGTAVQTPRAQGQNRNNAQGAGARRPRQDVPMDIEIIPLQVTENRYKMLKDVPQDVKLLRALNAILNKLTPEKFDTLIDQVLELNIETAALLRDVVTAVFEKALAEPNYSPVYAEFCVKLTARLPSFPADESDTQNTHNFKRLVLNQCQTEFENQDNQNEGAGKVDPEVFAAMSEEDKQEHVTKQKRRMLGTIRFIGELFVRAMLAGKIMKSCLVLLLGDVQNPNEENIEALCKLLETVGKLLDQKTQKNNYDFMNTVFGELELLAQPPSKANNKVTESGRAVLSSRLRFMIQDTLDLRRKDWVLRRKNEVNAKKISDVHKESAAPAQDARASSAAAPRAALAANRFGGKAKDRYSVAPASPSPRTGAANNTPKNDAEAGWETATTKGNKRSQDVRGGTSMSRTNSGSNTANSAASTPSHRASGPPTPQKGYFNARSAANVGDKKEKQDNNGKANAFALLHAAGEEDEEDHHDGPPAARSGLRTDASSSSAALDDEDAVIDDDEVAAAANLSLEEIDDKVRRFMKEYMSEDDSFEEVRTCIKEVGGKSALSAASVQEAILFALENKDRERNALAKLLPQLFAEEYLSSQQIETGFSTLLEMCEDLVIDFPRLIEHTAALFAACIQDGVFELTTIKTLGTSIVSPDDRAKFAIFTLQALNKKKQEANVGDTFVATVKDSGLSWTELTGEEGKTADQIKKLLTAKNLEMLVGTF